MSTEQRAPAGRRYPHPVRRELVLDAAERLFVEHGYATVTMEGIAREAGVTRPIVYKHFATRESAYVACVQRARRHYDREMMRRVRAEDTLREQLRAGADAYFEMLEQSPGRWLLLFGSNAILSGEHGIELDELRFSTIEGIAALLRSATADPDAPDERLLAFAHAASGICERLGHWWLRNPDLTRADVVDHYISIIWDGMAAYLEQTS